MATTDNTKTDSGHMPKTVREQIFYMYGHIMGLETNAVGNVMINANWIADNFDKALQLAYEEELPKIAYRDVELPKGMSIASTSYPPKSVNHCSDSF